MRRSVLALALVLTLAGCGDDDGDTQSVGQASATPTASASTAPSTTSTACQASGTGTTDLTKKPAVTKPAGAAPTETTTYDIVCGTGDEAKAGSHVEVKYVGVLHADLKEFDASWNRGAEEVIEFNVGENVIPGFSIGATGMREGGRRMVVIPPKDGYGPDGVPPTIPANATLIFVMDLVSVS